MSFWKMRRDLRSKRQNNPIWRFCVKRANNAHFPLHSNPLLWTRPASSLQPHFNLGEKPATLRAIRYRKKGAQEQQSGRNSSFLPSLPLAQKKTYAVVSAPFPNRPIPIQFTIPDFRGTDHAIALGQFSIPWIPIQLTIPDFWGMGHTLNMLYTKRESWEKNDSF